MDDLKIKEFVDEYAELTLFINRKYTNLMRIVSGEPLTPEQLYVLIYIEKAGKVTSSKLAEVFEVKKSSITSIVNRLVDKNLVYRTNDPKDRRTIHLTTTEEGKSLYKKIDSKMHNMLTPIILSFDDQEIKNLISYLRKLNTLLGNIDETT